MMDVVIQNGPLTGFRESLVCGALIALLYACGGPDTGPEEELRDWVQRGAAAVEGKKRHELIGMISPAYADSRGNEQEGIERIITAYFFRMNNIELLTSIDEVRVMGESAAELVLTVAMAGTNDGVPGFSADAYRFELELEQGDGEWRLISARWGELGKELR